MWFPAAQELLDAWKLKSHPLQLLSGGLMGNPYGLGRLKLKKVSGEKLVCLVQGSSHRNVDQLSVEELTPSGRWDIPWAL